MTNLKIEMWIYDYCFQTKYWNILINSKYINNHPLEKFAKLCRLAGFQAG